MPVDLETSYKRLLREIMTISQGIRNPAFLVEYANNQNFHVAERLRRQLETMRISAERRFCWVPYQLDALKRRATRLELSDALDILPTEVEAIHERVLGAIDERKSEGKLARRALAWLVVALEPLRLAQIVDGFSVDTQRRKIDRGTQWLEAALLDRLSSVVLYYEETDVLTSSHLQSVKEYLTGHTTLPMYHMSPHEAHAEAQ